MFGALLATAEDPRVAFQIGNLTVRWYGIIIVSAMILALIYACFQAKKIDLKADDIIELFLWIIPLAVVFARVFYVFPGRIDEYFPWNSWQDFVNAIAIWDGGITIIGGMVGGILGGIFFVLRHRKETNFLKVADLVSVPLIMAQVMGRWGNFVNQEAFGLPITDPRFQHFPFGVYITDPGGISDEFKDLVYSNTPGWFCATFFYEQVWNFIGGMMMFVFWQKGKNKKYPGLMIMFYFFWYFLGRLWLEFLRLDAVPVTKIACGVVIPVAFLIGTLYVVYCNSKQAYDRVEKLAKSDAFGAKGGVPALTAFEIKNYAFVGKVKANKRNPLNILYGKREYAEVNFDEVEYYAVPKRYAARFKKLVRTETYFREAEV